MLSAIALMALPMLLQKALTVKSWPLNAEWADTEIVKISKQPSSSTAAD